jgi:hypothetical protein
VHALLEAGRVEDSLGDKELSTMERLRDGQVMFGGARYEHYAGSQRLLVNQMRTSNVGLHTF